MTDSDFTSLHPAYVAGLIDGEGCLMLRRREGQSKPIAIVSINMTHEETIALLAEYYAPDSRYRREGGAANHKPTYRIDWRGDKAVSLLEVIRPYLITKRQQADVLLEAGAFISRKRGRPRKGTSWWTDAERARMDELMETMARLNRRGRGGG